MRSKHRCRVATSWHALEAGEAERDGPLTQRDFRPLHGRAGLDAEVGASGAPVRHLRYHRTSGSRPFGQITLSNHSLAVVSSGNMSISWKGNAFAMGFAGGFLRHGPDSLQRLGIWEFGPECQSLFVIRWCGSRLFCPTSAARWAAGGGPRGAGARLHSQGRVRRSDDARLIERLEVDGRLCRLCGWSGAGRLPSERRFRGPFPSLPRAVWPAVCMRR